LLYNFLVCKFLLLSLPAMPLTTVSEWEVQASKC
jgi:hypothetical protein